MNDSSHKLLDTRLEIPAPEFTVFHSHLAGPSVRLLSIILDHFILLIIMFFLVLLMVLLQVFNFAGYLEGTAGVAQFMIFLALFVCYWFFFFLQEALLRGRTVGKIAFKLRVISIDGTSLDLVQVLLRNLLRFADMFPLLFGLFPTYFTGILTSFFDPVGFRRLGDLAAGTIVVREPRKANMIVEVNQQTNIRQLADQLKLKHQPSVVLTQAINNFADHLKQLHPLRAQEIAKKTDEKIRIIFDAEKLECDPVEMLLAAHAFLNSLTGKEMLKSNEPHKGNWSLKTAPGNIR